MKKTKLLLATTALAILAGVAEAQVATISTTDLLTSGISTTAMGASASPTYFGNDGFTFLAVARDGTTKTGTIRSQVTSISTQGLGPITLADQTLSIPSGTGVVLAGPFPKGRWNNTQYDTVRVDWSAPVSLTVLRLPQ